MLTKEQVQHIARLARLGLREDEIEAFASDLSRILESVAKLREVKTEEIEPIAHITGLENAYRNDDPAGPKPQATPELLVGQFPQRQGSGLRVPAVFDQ